MTPMRAFFSHRFDPALEPTLNFIRSVSAGLGVTLKNVANASGNTPINEATELIRDCDFLIALCTRDVKIDGGGFLPSQSVVTEIATAYNSKKPIICFVDNGVSLSGFAPNMFTFKDVNTVSGLSDAFVNSIVEGISNGKKKVAEANATFINQDDLTAYYVRNVEMQIELQRCAKGLFWEYVIEREIVYAREPKEPLAFGLWSLPDLDGAFPRPLARIELYGDSSSRFTMKTKSANAPQNGIEIKAENSPKPTKDDVVKIREVYRSPYLNRVYRREGETSVVEVNGKALSAYDGVCIVNRIEQARISVRFPSSYAVDDESVVVSTFSNHLDVINRSETSRLSQSESFSRRRFNGRLELELTVDRPLFQYFYGFGWNPPILPVGQMSWVGANLTWDD